MATKAETSEKSTGTEVIEPGSVSASTLEAEIAAAVELASKPEEDDAAPEEHVAEVVADVESATEDAPAKDESEDELVEEEPEEEEKPEEPKGLSDKAIERAVRAGLPLDQVKQCPSDAFLDAMCARIEGATEEAGSQSGAGNEDPEGQSLEDLLAAIPDLDSEDYEQPLVDGFKSLKEIIKQQSVKIAELSGGRSQDWFATKLEGVKNLTKGDAGKTDALRVKYDVLKAGYSAAGQDVTDQAVFDEAAKLVLSSEMEAARQKKKGSVARSRSGQFANRPSGNRAKAQPDATTEIAAMIDAKHFS